MWTKMVLPNGFGAGVIILGKDWWNDSKFPGVGVWIGGGTPAYCSAVELVKFSKNC